MELVDTPVLAHWIINGTLLRTVKLYVGRPTYVPVGMYQEQNKTAVLLDAPILIVLLPKSISQSESVKVQNPAQSQEMTVGTLVFF